jgi:hypothetical protein
MDLYLSCEKCLRLWAEYGTATIEMRAGAVRTEWEAASSKRRLRDVLEAMRQHEAEAHQETRRTHQVRDLA